MCFVCGEKNDFGLHGKFYETEANELIALISPTEEHQGYPRRMHGGIAAAILDETMARAVYIGKEEQVWGVTLELKTKFRRPAPLGQELKIVARVTSEGSRTFEASGELLLPDGEVAVSAEGKYIKMKTEGIADELVANNEWYIKDNPDDPREIEIP